MTFVVVLKIVFLQILAAVVSYNHKTNTAANICRNTIYKTTTHITTKHSLLNKRANTKTSIPYRSM